MRQSWRKFLEFLICISSMVIGFQPARAADDAAGWKAGVATVVVTPDELTWMAGYASRDKPAEGKVHELFAKALALEDAGGARLVIVTTDLIGIPRPMRDFVEKQVQQKFQLPPAGLLLNSSHTHCGPVVRIGESALYSLDEEQRRRVDRYAVELREKLVRVVGEALEKLEPAQIGYTHARAGFAMNRRLPTETGPQNSPYPEGPVDHDVPVLRVAGADDKLRTVLFGYACRNTTLAFFQYCGDYAGYAQEYFEETHPGTTALFLMGCGGDQNPYPRGTLDLAKLHGRTLATAIDAALLPKTRPVRGPLRSAIAEVPLDFAPPSRAELEKQAQSANRFEKRHAELLLEQLREKGELRKSYPYLVQAVRFGEDITLIAMAGEVVVDYSHRLKRELPGGTVWVVGYSNDVFAYVPSKRVLEEGGYEGVGAMLFTTLPGPFAPTVEERIVAKIHELVERLKPAASTGK